MDELVKILAPKLRRLTIPVNYGSLTGYLEITDCMSAADLLEAQAQRIKELEAAINEISQHITRVDWYYLKDETKLAIGYTND